LLNHPTSKISAILLLIKFLCGCLKFGGLNVELGF
jgi:hypothetical protein